MVVDPAGPPCGCGANGCLEQVAGQEALLARAAVLGEAGTPLAAPDGAVAELQRRAAAGDARTLDALAGAGTALGVAIAGLVNVVDVPVVLLGGLYARLGEWLVDPIGAELERRVVSREWAPVEVVVSQLGADAAVRGAAGSVIQALIAAG